MRCVQCQEPCSRVVEGVCPECADENYADERADAAALHARIRELEQERAVTRGCIDVAEKSWAKEAQRSTETIVRMTAERNRALSALRECEKALEAAGPGPHVPNLDGPGASPPLPDEGGVMIKVQTLVDLLCHVEVLDHALNGVNESVVAAALERAGAREPATRKLVMRALDGLRKAAKEIADAEITHQ